MKNKAFTLIELLVVVLIIGILAAIAVPQYQKAVAKSHYIFVHNLAASLYQAEKVYYLANGKYTNVFNDLDITMPPAPNPQNCISTQCFFDWGFCSIYVNNLDMNCTYGRYGHNRIALYIDLNNGKRSCVAVSGTGTNENVYDQICKQETGKEADNPNSSARYYSYY